MNAIVSLIEEAIAEKLRLIDFLREENRKLTKALREAEERIKELSGDYLNETERGDF